VTVGGALFRFSPEEREQRHYIYRNRRILMTKRHFLLKDVARVLKVKPYQIAYALSVGLVPEPALRISNKRIFAAEDVARLAEPFKVDLPTKPARKTHDAP
jgi:hypothetical protein